MQPDHPLSPTISLAFATPILRRRFPECGPVNEGLSRAIREKERAEPSVGRSLVGGWHSHDDLFDWPYPEIRVFRSWVSVAVQEMIQFTMPELAGQGPLNIDLGGGAWANIVRSGSYHKIHNHPDCDWSGVYYVAIGTPDPNGPPENGMIEFLDPRMGALQPGVRGPEAPPKLRVPPEPGLMLLFPSWLYHYVNTFHGTGERISIAFNVKLTFRSAKP